jgi:type II secretory pathway pseudopilin PulG
MKKRWLPGQTLVEMLIVLFVISVGLYAAVGLIISNLNLQQLDADQTMAMNVAREALELVQNKRDSNWLDGTVAFDEGILVDGAIPKADCTAVPAWDGDAVPDPFFIFAGKDTVNQARLYRSNKVQSLGVFTNVSTATTTDFFRLLTFIPICQDPADPSKKAVADNLCDCPPTTNLSYTRKIGIRAKADVQWFRNGRQKNLTIFGDYYDWR